MLKKLKYFLKNQKLNRRKKTFGPFAKGIIYETENGIISMSHEDMVIGKHLGFKGSWNLPEIEILKENLKREDTLYIIGTHVGTLLIPLSKNCKCIIGYEANPNTFWFLNQNIQMNNLKNTTTFNFAIGNEKRKTSFYKSKINTGGSKIKPVHNDLMYNFDNPEEVEVDMVSLDKHLSEKNLPTPDGIIMDIEGAEYAALQGMQKTLENVRFLYMEYVPHHLKNVSNVTNEELIKLIAPFFSKVISTRKQVEINIGASTSELTNFLDELDATEKSDDLLFLKR